MSQTIATSSGLSQARLAHIIGVSRATMHYAQADNRGLPPGATLKLAKLEAYRSNPENIEKVTKPLRDRELINLNVMLKKQDAIIARLEHTIGNKERELMRARESFNDRLQRVQSGYLALQLSIDEAYPEQNLNVQRSKLAGETEKFHAKGPARQIALLFDLERLRSELASAVYQKSRLSLIIEDIKKLSVAEWAKLLD